MLKMCSYLAETNEESLLQRSPSLSPTVTQLLFIARVRKESINISSGKNAKFKEDKDSNTFIIQLMHINCKILRLLK